MSLLNPSRDALLKGEIDLLNSTIRAIALTSFTTSWTTLDKIPVGNRLAISDPLENVSLFYYSGGVSLDADDRSFPAASGNMTYLALLIDTGVEATTRVLSYVFLNQVLPGVPFTVVWNSGNPRILYSTNSGGTDKSFFVPARGAIFSGQIDLLGDTIKVALVDSSYTPNFNTDTTLSDLPGGAVLNSAPLTGKTILNGYFDAANTMVPGGVAPGKTISQLILYKDTGDPANSPLIARMTVTPAAGNGQDFVVVWSTNGVLYF